MPTLALRKEMRRSVIDRTGPARRVTGALRLLTGFALLAASVLLGSGTAWGQDEKAEPAQGAAPAGAPEPAAAEEAVAEGVAEERVGYRVQVPLPLRGEAAAAVRSELQNLAQTLEARGGGGRRPTVVLEFASGGEASRGSTFEGALLVARWLGSREARSLRTVAYVAGPLEGHAVLPVLACDEFVVAPTASLGNASADEVEVDPAVALVYTSIAARRGAVPEAAVQALVDPRVELVLATPIEGPERFVTGAELAELRDAGQAWKEEQLSAAGRPALFSAAQLRNYRWASQIVESPDQLATALGLSRLDEPTSAAVAGPKGAVRIALNGPINSSRVRRYESNIAAALSGEKADSLFVMIDSPGGDLGSSLWFAMTLSAFNENPGVAVGYVENEARGDAALVAIGCKPLYLNPQARIGGSGAEAITRRDVLDLREAIEELALQTGRPAALLVGLLDPTAEIYRYTDRRTGRIAYFEGGRLGTDDAEQWQRGERIEMSNGLTASEAIRLGLAEGEADSPTLAASRGGFEELPPPLADRPIVHAVEWLAGIPGLPMLLLFLGCMAFAMELSAPGLGIPGFISMLCFTMFFWISFLSGTAEWLEVSLFVGGVICILIEVLVIPGVGVFGIGGLLMVVASIVLASQTFVIPRNAYQYEQTTLGLLTVLVAFGGIMGGLVALRFLLPGVPLFRHLIMPGPNSDEMIEQEQREHLVHYEWLLGLEGVAVTPLRPAGKARFQDQVVAVVSEGSPLSPGDPLRVIEVHGNRVVVEPA
ncbi:NfeD family protein [Candidatus Laterigemmans baculatus]|uniref:NfeD family protein n=1 Tax=Candidatus Laterigemmans baculatus TaxID=2770505 RepID=UPI0013D94C27|nr:NfeD family protein [Candidatus Laterigemmans baculatus]